MNKKLLPLLGILLVICHVQASNKASGMPAKMKKMAAKLGINLSSLTGGDWTDLGEFIGSPLPPLNLADTSHAPARGQQQHMHVVPPPPPAEQKLPVIEKPFMPEPNALPGKPIFDNKAAYVAKDANQTFLQNEWVIVPLRYRTVLIDEKEEEAVVFIARQIIYVYGIISSSEQFNVRSIRYHSATPDGKIVTTKSVSKIYTVLLDRPSWQPGIIHDKNSKNRHLIETYYAAEEITKFQYYVDKQTPPWVAQGRHPFPGEKRMWYQQQLYS